MKLTTAGESHGKALVAIIEGLPAHLQLNIGQINEALSLRQQGYGRGARQKIERDQVEVLTGLRNGETLGSPLTLCIYNQDFVNWESCMSAEDCSVQEMSGKALTKVRPGHADLAGMQKFRQEDARNILERASARETAIRVAAGEVYRQFLSNFGVEIAGYVQEVCGVKDGGRYVFTDIFRAKSTPLGMLNIEKEKQAIEKINELKKVGDTAGGVVEIRVKGLKSGFGSMMTYAEKLDGILAQALMSIQAVKGVEIGEGFALADKSGRETHDEIFYTRETGFYRETNRAGGIEGGMSNGEELVIRLVMKPIPTLKKGLRTVDYTTKEPTIASAERSDVCAIFALERIAEAVVAEALANVVAKRLGGDTMYEMTSRYTALP